jgi:hypothetical protein
MASYVVLTPPDTEAGDEEILVRDGFTLLAFLVPVIWFVWHRMWLWAAAFLLGGLAVAVAIDRTDWDGTALFAAFLMALWAGLEAGGQRVGALVGRGWTVRDVVVASGRDVAEAAYFRSAKPEAPPTGSASRPVRPVAARQSGGPALGLLDYDGGN